MIHRIFQTFLSKRKPQDTPICGEVQASPLFDQPYYTDITNARIDHLRDLQLPFQHKRVIDVGCGIGRFCDFFFEKGSEIFCVDGREQNIQKLRDLYPTIQSAVIDLENTDMRTLGMFDIVFCYGLLYHLSDPLSFIRNVSSACSEFMIIETCITDADDPILRLVAEDIDNETQALHGFGCRPSPSYITTCLELSGFQYIYTPRFLPHHSQFQYRRENDLSYTKNNNNIRAIFIGSHRRINNSNLRHVSLSGKS